MKEHLPADAGLKVNEWVKGINGFGAGDHLGLCVRTFAGENLAGEFSLPLNGESEGGNARWNVSTAWSPVNGRAGCFDLETSITLLAGNAESASVAVAACFAGWERDAYVLMPGIVYAGNRFDIIPMAYAPLIRDREKFRLDMPPHMTEQPHLKKDGSACEIDLDTGYVTTPAMGFYDRSGRGFLMQTHQRNQWGNFGLTVQEDNVNGVGRLLVSSPPTRKRRLDWNTWEAKIPDWPVGGRTTIKVRVWFFHAEKLQALFDHFAEFRKDLNPTRLVNNFPFSAAAELVRNKWNARNWDDQAGFYSGDEDHSRQHANRWQLGWTNGGIVTLPLFQQGDAITRQRALRELDFIFERTPAPSGFFNGSSDGRRCYGDAFGEPHPHNMTMVRKQGDALYYTLRQLLLLNSLGQDIPLAWKKAVRGLAGAFVRLFRKYGQTGQFLDVETGELLLGGSTAGGIVPAGLALAAKFFDEPDYLVWAESMGRFFVRESVERGLTTGGPGEALAAPDSESCYGLLKSMVTLHESTGKSYWANVARDLTRQFATWVVSYDYQFPANSPLGQIHALATGSVVANSQNQHSAPGICTHSGDDLFRLWRATGDEFALQLIRDIAHNLTQYVSRPDQPVGKLLPGMICERVNLSDWEGESNVGGHIFGSCAWPEVAMLLTAAEIPGVYVRTDSGRLEVFDHVEARLETSNGRPILVLRNPTEYDAKVSVLAESGEQAADGLPIDTLRTAEVIAVGAGQTVELPLNDPVRLAPRSPNNLAPEWNIVNGNGL